MATPSNGAPRRKGRILVSIERRYGSISPLTFERILYGAYLLAGGLEGSDADFEAYIDSIDDLDEVIESVTELLSDPTEPATSTDEGLITLLPASPAPTT